VVLLTAIALALPPQLRDMMAFLSYGFGWSIIAFHVALALLAFSAWYWARTVLAARFGVPDQGPVRETRLDALPDLDTTAYQWLPRWLFVAVVVLGLLLLLLDGGGSWTNAVCLAIWGSAGFRFVCIRSYGSLTKAAAAQGDGLVHGVHDYGARMSALTRHAPLGAGLSIPLLVGSLLLFGASALLSFIPEGNRAWTIGTWLAIAFPGPAVAVLGLAMIIGPLTMLTLLADRHDARVTIGGVRVGPRRPPVISMLMLYIFILVPWKLHVHTVRVVEDATRYDKRVTLEKVLKGWADTCYPNKGLETDLHPIIVAVSGGATRAGLWAASVLQRVVQAEQPGGPALFAISSVSGGSLGAGAAMSLLAKAAPLLKEQHCYVPNALDPLGPASDTSPVPLSGDALGPLLAGWLFNDIPRAVFAPLAALLRAAPWSGTLQPRGGDSAAAIEDAFARLWRPTARHLHAIGFEQPYLSLFYDSAGRYREGVPLWFANGTDAGTGDRLITSPVRTHTVKPANTQDQGNKPQDRDDASAWSPWCQGGADGSWPFPSSGNVLERLCSDVRIATAINNTARFPYLEPFGELLPVETTHGDAQSAKSAGSLVDGGYFENEGLQTAFDLANWLRHEAKSVGVRSIEPIIVQATADGEAPNTPVITCDPPAPAVPVPPTHQGSVLPQVFAPVIGLYNVRGGHSAILLYRAHDGLCSGNRFVHFYLPPYGSEPIPLNWVLSDTLAHFIWRGSFTYTMEARNPEELHALHCIMAGKPRGCAMP